MGESGKSARSVFFSLALLLLLAAVIVTLLLLIQKFNKSDHDRHLDNEELYRLVQEPLSPHIRPLHYLVDLDLSFEWHVHDGENRFGGNVKVILHIGNVSTKYIALDSRGLDVHKIQIFNYTWNIKQSSLKPGPSRTSKDLLNEIPLARWFLYPPTDRMVVETTSELTKDSTILLEVSFYGGILNQNQHSEEEGLVKYNFSDRVVLATSYKNKHGGQQTRKIFPCFDDMKFLSIFSISVRHNSSFLVLSNADQASKDESLDPQRTIFKTTDHLATRHFALIVGQMNKFPVEKHMGINCEPYSLVSDNYDKNRIGQVFQGMKPGYDDIWKNFTHKIVIFPSNVVGPQISTRGLISVSLSDDKLSNKMEWLASVLRMDGADGSWLEEGLKDLNEEIPKDYDSLADDFGYRRLDRDNSDITGSDKHFLIEKTRSILRLLDKDYSDETINKALKTVLKRRIEEDQKNHNFRRDLQITLAWYSKRENERRREILQKWYLADAVKFNSTCLEEILTEIDKMSNDDPKRNNMNLISSWTTSSDYPVLTVDLVKGQRSLRITQHGFHHPDSNHTWEFPLEFLASGKHFKDWISKKENVIADVETGGLVVVDPDRRVYGRVNYGEDHWRRLFSDLNVLEGNVRRVLIEDMFSLARGGHVGYDLVLNSLTQLRTPSHWGTGKLLEEKIRQIDFALKDSELWEEWAKYLRELVGSIYDTSKGQEGVTAVACLHGYLPCKEDALSLHQFGNRTLIESHDLKRMALYQHGSSKHFTVDGEALRAALVIRGSILVQLSEYLRKVQEGSYDKYSFMTLYSEVNKYYANQHDIWSWFRNNIRELQKVFSRYQVATMLETSATNFYAKGIINDARYIMREGGISMEEINYLRIQHKLNSNYVWLERNQMTLRDWFMNRTR